MHCHRELLISSTVVQKLICRSTMHSTNATPQVAHRAPSTIRQTSQSRARSRIAGALRNDGELMPGDLPQIEEEDLSRQRTRSDAGAGEGDRDRERILMQSTVMASPHASLETGQQSLTRQRNMNDRPPQQVRKAPSMPPSRHQPRVSLSISKKRRQHTDDL